MNDASSLHLLSELPPIRRSRGGYLYTQNGERLLDLWLNNATILQGHQPAGLLTVAKNALAQTFIHPYPSHWHQRAIQAIQITFDAHAVHIAPHRALCMHEPWHHHPKGYYLLRAGIPLPKDCTIAQLALPLSGYACYLLIDKNAKNELPTAEILPAYLARTLLRMLTHLLNFTPEITPITSTNFSQHHAYFTYNQTSIDSHQALFRLALKEKILLPPSPQATGLWLPHLFSAGQNQTIKAILS
ncbi:hypothetical protein [Entomospira culicis]|uniref:Uncharacterized protein n=1 Tax=Entomospira culicis TaxID=2719989 RepID=A0A968KZ77_9SPIO|nr:hypothetical protein [Entomospira culicis]NIZ18821.1 hypothetical protein [Entomospira culicis]NIZ69036.1 hypothetical protein [Entomospira culicis]WDI37624.1 hypothetical protein PVA46_02245 [Entomospira culicis]WDI39252.1 hypothetical protein PVA47_02250 [Entomospira culicis]